MKANIAFALLLISLALTACRPQPPAMAVITVAPPVATPSSTPTAAPSATNTLPPPTLAGANRHDDAGANRDAQADNDAHADPRPHVATNLD